MIVASRAFGLAVTVLLTFLAATLAFDTVHALLHRALHSRKSWLRAVGSLHDVHHRFLDRDLRIHPELVRANLTHHVIPEYLTQLTATLLLATLLPLAVFLGTLALETIVFLMILRARGMDINHRSYEALPAYRPQAFFCVPHYHALHHVFPDAYYGSWLKGLDQLLGTAAWLRGRRVLLTGAQKPLVQALAEELALEGAEVKAISGEPDAAMAAALDLLVLHHAHIGSETAYVSFVERLLRETRDRKIPPEVWVVVPETGADAEFQRRSRGYYFDARVSWRHLAVNCLEREARWQAPHFVLGPARLSLRPRLLAVPRAGRIPPLPLLGRAALFGTASARPATKRLSSFGTADAPGSLTDDPSHPASPTGSGVRRRPGGRQPRPSAFEGRLHQRLEFAVQIHLAHDVRATEKLPADEHLRNRRPVREFLDRPAQLGIFENVYPCERHSHALEHLDRGG